MNYKRYFFGYGWLLPLSWEDYLNELLNWVYEDSDSDDGTIICSNEITGEFRYVLKECNLDDKYKIAKIRLSSVYGQMVRG